MAGGPTSPPTTREHGGFVISAAVNRYIFIAINRTFGDDYFLKYSELERVRHVDDIEHPIIREALRLHPIGPSIELVSVADIPAGTGLGSSGAFTVGLLRALYAFKREHVTAANLAEEACRIEIDVLNRPVGKQDQYIASFGGLTCLDIEPGGQVNVSPLLVSNETLRDLEEHLCMFFTHYSRPADVVLDEQRSQVRERRPRHGRQPALREGERAGHQGRPRDRGTRPASRRSWTSTGAASGNGRPSCPTIRSTAPTRSPWTVVRWGASSWAPGRGDSSSSMPRISTPCARPWPARA